MSTQHFAPAIYANVGDHRAAAIDVDFRNRAARGSVCIALFAILSDVDSDAASKDSVSTDPTIDTASIVPDLESFTLLGFDQVNVFPSIDFAKHDVTDLNFVFWDNWNDRA